MSITDCQFPLLIIEPDGSVETADNRDKLECCDERIVEHGCHKGRLYIDPTGRNWAVLSARIIEIIKPRRRLWVHAWVRVELDAIEGRQLDLEGVQDRLCKAIEKEPHAWDACEDLGESIARVRNAQDIPSLIGEIARFQSMTFPTSTR